MGYAHPLVFKHVNDEHINKVENFIRLRSKNISDSKEDLFGKEFANDSERFEFLPGDRLLIQELVAHVQKVIVSDGTNNGMQHFQLTSIDSSSKCDITIKHEIQHNNTRTHFLLGKLIATADRNVKRKKGGYRYDAEIKRYAAYLRMIAGTLAYETIQKNLVHSLPSLSSTNRYIKSGNCNVIEGVLRSEELLLYLKERSLPLVVSLSEDATRITGRIQYDSSCNQIVGFTLPLNRSNGMPMPYAFPARNVHEIYSHFSGENSISHFLNVIMAQAVSDGAKPFCLLAFGSDNSYSSDDVSKRWKYITNELKKIGINVLTISSDSDPRYNAAMRALSKLGYGQGVYAAWFSCDGEIFGPFFFQDTVHIGTKLRNFFLRTIWNELKLPFGKYYINWSHLNILLHEFTKDEHQLTASVLNPVDKQNFRSVLRMCDPKVILLLKQHVEGSEATALFLQMTRDIIDAFLDESLNPIQRIRKMWFSIFVVRIWRHFIISHKKYTLKDNFLTSNCYTCLELNAHSMVMCMLHLQQINRPDLFLPHMFESQPCESMFRQLRSFTSTFSTVTNCTVKEAISRISKIQLQNDIIHGTSPYFVYPRLGSKPTSNTDQKKTIVLPSRAEIITEIQKCQRDAIAKAKLLGLIPNKRNTEFSCKVPPYTTTALNKIRKNKCIRNINKAALNPPHFKNIQLKNFSDKLNEEINATGPYVEILTDDGQRIVVKKTSLCWLWSPESKKLSSDRLLRVQYSAKNEACKRIKKKVKKSSLYSYKPISKKKK